MTGRHLGISLWSMRMSSYRYIGHDIQNLNSDQLHSVNLWTYVVWKSDEFKKSHVYSFSRSSGNVHYFENDYNEIRSMSDMIFFAQYTYVAVL